MEAAGVFFAAAFFVACTAPPTTVSPANKEFNLPSFFQQEIKRLSSDNKEVVKTVSKGDSFETKTIQIDWEKELAAFTAIDINKAVYSGYIHKDSSDHLVTLRVDNPDADISLVRILYDEQNEPLQIVIHREIRNLLYNTVEKLSYKKDHSYSIEKKQNVWLLGTNHYTIKGLLSN